MNYLEELTVDALISVPGCPEPLIHRALRSALSEFYRDTKAWRITTDPAPVRAGVREVEIELPSFTNIGRIFWAKLDDKPLTAIPMSRLRTHEGKPQGYAVEGLSRVVSLDVIPTENYLRNGLVVHASLVPSTGFEQLDDQLYEMHRDGILYGALAKLLAMPNVPWTNLGDANIFLSMAAGLRHEARREADSLQAPVRRVVRYGGI